MFYGVTTLAYAIVFQWYVQHT